MAKDEKKVGACEECRFYSTAPQGNGPGPAGICHRFPQTYRKNADDWCGEGEKLPKPPKD